MSARVWKFLSNTIGKLQSPRPAQQHDNSNNSPSLRQIESNPDTPTRHGNSKNVGEELENAGLSTEQDDSVLDAPLDKISNIKEKLEGAVKPITKNEVEDEPEEDVTAENPDNIEAEEAPKPTKKSANGKPVAVLPPRQGRNKRGGSAEKVETLAHTEVPVENTRKTRGRGRPAKNAKPAVEDETIAPTTQAEDNGVEEEEIAEVAELSIKDEPSVDNSTNRKPRGRGRPSKPKSYEESHQSEAETMAEEVEASNSNNPIEKPHANRSNAKRPLLPKVADQVHVSESSIDTPPVANNKRRRDVLESSVGTEDPEMSSSASVSNKRRKTSAKPEGPGIPPIGTTQEAKDERRKYMDRERQRRCRQRKKDRQQGLQEAEREVLAQAKDERKKAMARERVRRHRDNQRQKQGVEVETKASGRQRTREEARQRDRELIAGGGRSGARNSTENESFSE
ncbi:hypothetical protein BCIN_03g09050 [Botrytis cinerea B05.10]|uniref:Uncharacterized protein n=1 Tax=Botryotinia fuckeliana (strain B05.10) TaxID=332648 RepID=A0A384JDN4_BOTFB|nr:hypothetical protein BCIN_03g09050 [Botrytis cinerea B05.10]ATZ48725.1 hypothetical protein BCIN_03g09050 [Botrytis cinerea B05.10]